MRSALHPTPRTARDHLRHTLATLAYRAGKAVSVNNEAFADFRIGETTRTPLAILSHMGDIMEWALTQARGEERWNEATASDWAGERERFFSGLAALDSYLASASPLGQDEGRIFQGAVADALTHVGQINLLRRLAGDPVRGENYNRADIQVGRVGREQSPPRREFD
jgi:hypothetical protein